MENKIFSKNQLELQKNFVHFLKTVNFFTSILIILEIYKILILVFLNLLTKIKPKPPVQTIKAEQTPKPQTIDFGKNPHGRKDEDDTDIPYKRRDRRDQPPIRDGRIPDGRIPEEISPQYL